MYVVFGILTPSGGDVLKLWPKDCFISSLTYARMSSLYVSFEKTKIFLCICSDSVDMVGEFKCEDMLTPKYRAFSTD